MLSSRQRTTFLTFYIAGILSGTMICYFMSKSNYICSQGDTVSPFARRPRSEMARDLPLVFIGGHPRSGTTLMRVLLDAHPSLHCGQETHIIPDLLNLRRKYSRGRGVNRLREAGLDLETINRTIANSIVDIIQSHGELSKRLCNKDPFTLKHIPYLARFFPKAQFLLMVRDARAVLHSIRENDIKISHFPKTDSAALRRWNKVLEIMFQDCLAVGPNRCKVVHYESLVLKSRFVLGKILKFLKTPWSETVLNHTKYLDKTGGIMLSRLERSTHQVRKPIYNDSLHLWMTSSSLNIPLEELLAWAPMMDTLGYIDIGNPPMYTELKIRYPHGGKL